MSISISAENRPLQLLVMGDGIVRMTLGKFNIDTNEAMGGTSYTEYQSSIATQIWNEALDKAVEHTAKEATDLETKKTNKENK